MNVIVHYNTDEGPQMYTIQATTKDEFERILNSFKNKTGLKDDQYTLQVVTTGV